MAHDRRGHERSCFADGDGDSDRGEDRWLRRW
uniref:Uncharacterized protein n=1 Tax=Arundo donax TaxID=35708 RepID=A0A0A8YA56_ARUDO